MKRFLFISIIILLLTPGQAFAIQIVKIGFDDGDFGATYTAEGQWNIVDIDTTIFDPDSTADNDNLIAYGGGSRPSAGTLELQFSGADLSMYQNLMLSIDLAATKGEFENTQVDKLTISWGTMEIDVFEPDSRSGADLQSLNGTDLGEDFKNYQYALPSIDANFIAGFEITWENEFVGLDNIEIYGNYAPTPEPATVLLVGIGILGIGIGKKKYSRK